MAVLPLSVEFGGYCFPIQAIKGIEAMDEQDGFVYSNIGRAEKLTTDIARADGIGIVGSHFKPVRVADFDMA